MRAHRDPTDHDEPDLSLVERLEQRGGRTRSGEGAAGFGKETEHGPNPFFWIQERGRPAVSGAHVAFGVRTTEQVDAFHAAALAAGGTDNGTPGPRPIYHRGYYGAFVLDPDGNNIEAVSHRAPTD